MPPTLSLDEKDLVLMREARDAFRVDYRYLLDIIQQAKVRRPKNHTQAA
jgi:hypothetical protein